jgi:hypothetical protein
VPVADHEMDCHDGRDDDCDGLFDCDDPDCAWDPACVCVPDETPEATCDDGRDNDCDGAADCDDGDCYFDPACMCSPDEWPEATCDDGRDNDCDGAIDCDDGDCDCCVPTADSELDCDDGRDEDCDGLTDCTDVLDCYWDPACRCIPTEIPESSCDDDEDNDCDDRVDCRDTDCRDDPVCWDNDTCGDAVAIDGPGSWHASTAGYTNDYSGDCAGRGPDAVFIFHLEESACVEIDTAGSSFDTVLYVRAADCYGIEVACNDDAWGLGLQSRIRMDLEPGLYYLFLDGWHAGASGNYTLNMGYCEECVPVADEEIDCLDGRDDDCDHAIDCDDPDCYGDPACWIGPVPPGGR